MKKVFIFLTLLIILLTSYTLISATPKIRLFFDNTEVILKTPLIVEDDDVYLPLREIIDALDGDVKWNAEDMSIQCSFEDILLKIWINQMNCEINDVSIKLNNKPKIINHHTYVSMELFEKIPIIHLDWDSSNYILKIRSNLTKKTDSSSKVSNIIYKSLNNKDLGLDIYPSSIKDKKSPVLVYIHSGSWNSRNKSDDLGSLAPLIAMLNLRGYSLVSIDYRLTDEAIFPANIEDCKDAIRWIRKNANEYNFNGDKIGVIGFSAGGHLSLLTALSSDATFNSDPNLKDYSSDVDFVISIAGPTYFGPESSKHPDVVSYLGGTYVENKINYIAASPVTYLNKNALPMLLIHGTEDSFVPYEYTLKFYEKAKTLGVDSTLITLVNGGHTPDELLKDDVTPSIKETMLRILAFVEKNFKNSKEKSID